MAQKHQVKVRKCTKCGKEQACTAKVIKTHAEKECEKR